MVAIRWPRPNRWATLLRRVRTDVGSGGAALVGFDVPIGIPAAYAASAGIATFRELLSSLADMAWPDFFAPAGSAFEVSVSRPFYPARVGDKRFAHLLAGLGLGAREEILRVCERATPNRGPACPLFWLIGANQVGKGALAGWQEMLIPALVGGRDWFRLWPFDGPLQDLVGPGTVTVVKTYPGEVYHRLGIRFPKSRSGERHGRRVQADRAASGATMIDWAHRAGVELSAQLTAEIVAGFDSRPDGEDRFDAVVGLLGMLEVALGRRAAGEPLNDQLTWVEGWIFGQESLVG